MSDEVSLAEVEQTQLYQAFKRFFTDPEFAPAVAADPDAALAGFELSAEDREALVSDAEALEGEVAGFGLLRDPLTMMGTLGGLRTPGRMGTSAGTLAYTGCLTCT